jgi:endonuclease/exonuclease/phosphatase family metal-dependent hydrolase
MPSESIKLLTYNVMRFDHEKPHLPGNPNPILKYIVDSNADIICLQEYSAFIKHNHLTETDIKRALKKYPYYRLLKLNGSSSNYIYGMALFSKYPISAFDDIALESAFNGAFIAELKIKDKKVTLISVHLESNRLSMKERATYYELTKEFDSSTFEEMRSEMNKRLAPAFKKRAEQAQLISEYIKKSINPYTIVCGDFNDTPISYSRHTIKGDLRDAFVETGTGLGTSYNRYRFLFRIDYILHSKNITPYRCTVDYAIRSSDHYPIWTCLQLN